MSMEWLIDELQSVRETLEQSERTIHAMEEKCDQEISGVDEEAKWFRRAIERSRQTHFLIGVMTSIGWRIKGIQKRVNTETPCDPSTKSES